MAASSEPLSDGCTGFQFLEPVFPIRDCCVVHDQGGSDGALVDCIAAVIPGPALPLLFVCMAIMVALRPVYHWIKGRRSR